MATIHTLILNCLRSATTPMTADEIVRAVLPKTQGGHRSIRATLRQAIHAGEVRATMDEQRNYTHRIVRRQSR